MKTKAPMSAQEKLAKRDQRIRAHAAALPRQVCCRKHWVSMNFHVWMPLAQHWQMPIAEIKRIVRRGEGSPETTGPEPPSRTAGEVVSTRA